MPLNLPEPMTERLVNAPLSLVVCQVRHESVPKVSEPTTGAIMRDQLKTLYPILEEQLVRELTIAVTANGGSGAPSAELRGWKLRGADRASTVVVMPDSFSLETTRYEDWATFSKSVELVTRAVAMEVRPLLEQRIGIRLINRMTHPEVKSARDWARWIDPAFLGPISHPRLGSAVSGSQQVFSLDVSDGVSMTVRHGVLSEPDSDRHTYLLDQDCFVNRGRDFDAQQVLDVIEHLHTVALQVFQQAITQDYYAYLRGD